MSKAAGSNRVKRSDIQKLLDGEDTISHKPIDFDARREAQGEENKEDRIVLFHLNGEDYSIPRRQQMNVGLKFTADRRKYGADIALVGLLTSMLGEEGFEALMSYEGLTASELETITEVVSRAALGKLEAQKAK